MSTLDLLRAEPAALALVVAVTAVLARHLARALALCLAACWVARQGVLPGDW